MQTNIFQQNIQTSSVMGRDRGEKEREKRNYRHT